MIRCVSENKKKRQKGKIKAKSAGLTVAAEISRRAEAARQLLEFTLIKEPNVALEAFLAVQHGLASGLAVVLKN